MVGNSKMRIILVVYLDELECWYIVTNIISGDSSIRIYHCIHGTIGAQEYPELCFVCPGISRTILCVSRNIFYQGISRTIFSKVYWNYFYTGIPKTILLCAIEYPELFFTTVYRELNFTQEYP